MLSDDGLYENKTGSTDSLFKIKHLFRTFPRERDRPTDKTKKQKTALDQNTTLNYDANPTPRLSHNQRRIDDASDVEVSLGNRFAFFQSSLPIILVSSCFDHRLEFIVHTQARIPLTCLFHRFPNYAKQEIRAIAIGTF